MNWHEPQFSNFRAEFTLTKMNDTPALFKINGCRRRPEAEDRIVLKILVVYDDRSSAIRAKSTLDRLARRLSFEIEFAYDFWRLDVLELREVQELARRAADTADIVVVATAQNAAVSPGAKRLLDGCILPNRRGPQAVVGLFQPSNGRPEKSEMHRFLQRVAESSAFAYFAPPRSADHDDLEEGQIGPSGLLSGVPCDRLNRCRAKKEEGNYYGNDEAYSKSR